MQSTTLPPLRRRGERERERESSARGDIMCVMYMCTCVKETAPLDIITFKYLGSVIKSVLHCYRQ